VVVDVQNGEVSLRGSVDDRRTKWLIEDVVEAVSGVREVRNELRVEETSPSASPKK
jgi:osmotically-inducible protein OsmY